MEQLRSVLASILLFFLLTDDALLVNSAIFTFVNNCGGPVWPGILSSAGSSKLETTGFQLPPGGSRAIQAPTGWSGRFWGRTGCSFDSSTGRGLCSTGDCGSGQIECNGAGANPPATLVEFTLASASGPSTLDFYDVSLVDGYNLPVLVQPSSSGSCTSTGCASDLNQKCPSELRVPNGDACKSACEAFNRPEYCCSGAFGNPNTCKPSAYSQLFKSACPRSYSYAYDDQTSTFTCAGGANYFVTFCPSGSTSPSSSQKSSTNPSSSTPQNSGGSTANSNTAPQFSGGINNGGSGNNYYDNNYNNNNNNNGVMLQDNSWLASLATGDSAPTKRPKCHLLFAFSFFLVFILVL